MSDPTRVNCSCTGCAAPEDLSFPESLGASAILRLASEPAPRSHQLFERVIFDFQELEAAAKRDGKVAFLRGLGVTETGTVFARYSVGPLPEGWKRARPEEDERG